MVNKPADISESLIDHGYIKKVLIEKIFVKTVFQAIKAEQSSWTFIVYILYL